MIDFLRPPDRGFLKRIPEMDGLRALAIGFVLLFHFEIKNWEGGFLGVDIFFVISGFLISRKILADIDRGEFKLLSFYKRRFYRIFPSLFVVLILAVGFGALIYSPESFVELSRASLMALVPVSNIFYWSQAGYFDKAGMTKPLLHTWSLGVEEQFYLFWPAILMVLMKPIRSAKARALFFILLIVVSFAAAAFFNAKSPVTSFFWMPLRIHQFALGALGAIMFQWGSSKNNWMLEFTLLVGLLLVLGCTTLLPKTVLESSVLPGLAVGIGSLFILCSARAKYLGSPFRFPAIQYLGRLSYTLYLVHWPVLVFFKYQKGVYFFRELGRSNEVTKTKLLLLSFLLSLLLHRAIELPFWKGQWNETILGMRKSLKWAFVLSPLLFGLLCWQIIASNGWLFRYPESVQNILKDNPTQFPGTLMNVGSCLTGSPHNIQSHCFEVIPDKKSVLLVGSSIMAALQSGLQKALSPHYQVYQYTLPGCGCMWKCNWKNMVPYCFKGYQRLINEILPKNRYEIILLNSRYYGKEEKDDAKAEREFKKPGQKVIYIQENPRLGFSMADRLAFYGEEGFQSFWNHSWALVNERQYPKTPEPDTLKLKTLFCDKQGTCQWKRKNKLFYADAIHLSEEGSLFVGEKIKEWLIERGLIERSLVQ